MYLTSRFIAKPLNKNEHSVATVSLLITFLLFMGIVAFSNYLDFDAKAKTLEAKQNLQAIYQSQKAYFQIHHAYAGGSQIFNLIHWKPESFTRYDFYMGSDKRDNTNHLVYWMNPNLDYRSWPYSVLPGSSPSGFTAVAVGNIDNDPFLDIWYINDQGKLINLANDLRDLDLPMEAALERSANEEGIVSRFNYLVWRDGFAVTIFEGVPLLLLLLISSALLDQRRMRKARA